MIELSENNESSVESQKQTFICHICEEKFENFAFEVHFPTCAKSLSTSQGLKQHVNTVHQTHKVCKCDFCGKSFTQPRALNTHIQAVHEGHKDYKCESCGKLFTTATYLKFHLKKHIHMVHEDHKDYKSEHVVNPFPKKEI